MQAPGRRRKARKWFTSQSRAKKYMRLANIVSRLQPPPHRDPDCGDGWESPSFGNALQDTDEFYLRAGTGTQVCAVWKRVAEREGKNYELTLPYGSFACGKRGEGLKPR